MPWPSSNRKREMNHLCNSKCKCVFEFYPSEVARLVLGYLDEVKCSRSWKTFLEESSGLKEHKELLKAGKSCTTAINNKSLLQFLAKYRVLEEAADDAYISKKISPPSKVRLIDAEEHKSIIQEKESITCKANRLLQDLEQCKMEITSLTKDLNHHRQQNKVLSDNNNKVVKALSAAEKKIQEAELKAKTYSKEMQNLLNEQIRELESRCKVNYAKEMQSVKAEAESIKKDADERILKAETQANLRLEEFQERISRLNQINFESEEKIREAAEERELMKNEFENFSMSLKEFLYRIFPNINVPQNFDQSSIAKYENEVVLHLEKVKKNAGHDSKDLENMIKKLEENSAEKLSLENQIKNYENVLAETNCTICFEPWTSSSEHRLVSLRCGHLFGRSCISRWLKEPNARCPQCNACARKTEIRNIYAKSIKVLDTVQRDKADEDSFICNIALAQCGFLERELRNARKQLQEYRVLLDKK